MQRKNLIDTIPQRVGRSMGRRVLILKPRLDLPFKRFAAAQPDPQLPEIRTYWDKFVENLKNAHRDSLMDHVHVVELPRWQFSNELVNFYSPDVAYIPHTEKNQFKGSEVCLYYMQTVFPELFTIDPKGWGGGSKFSETHKGVIEMCPPDPSAFLRYRKRIAQNRSKFKQPDLPGIPSNIPEKYIFVPLQLPHDETILYHSDVTVPRFVENLCRWSEKSTDIHIVFKGHPVNIASMEPLKKIISGYPSTTTYVEDVSIHPLMENCEMVYIINSGTGMEAMLHRKPVVAFGRAEYNKFVIEGNIKDLPSTYLYAKSHNEKELYRGYEEFFNWFTNRVVFNCEKINPFRLRE